MNKPEIAFRHFDGAGPLAVYWHAGPYGDAVEAREGHGVGWFTATGELLGVELDHVAFASDDQSLKFVGGAVVAVRVRRGRITVKRRPGSARRRAA